MLTLYGSSTLIAVLPLNWGIIASDSQGFNIYPIGPLVFHGACLARVLTRDKTNTCSLRKSLLQRFM